ncbi:DUF3140 domain-containing protein [Luteolibacter luteus]|uniref:DUF3140 domain-containing protein n=1 Tax=Luteolibacter luteus TaxID=2728835 RepID=A0A858RI14_9BACT|nr:DUF3140 domain-containing protein [Luteolibacter luteus]QJE96221.1 DUF3140 domain-containing protein [Luteolibacter luteus]
MTKIEGPKERRETVHDFREAVNMTSAQLEKWLDTEESRQVGWKGSDGKGSGESVGHRSGRKIITLLGKKQADLTEADLKHMRKVVGYVNRHLAQRPEGEVSETPWLYSLMNWGHDPRKH